MKRNLRKGLLLCLLLTPLAQGVEPATAPGKDEPLDTVLVEGTRAELNKVLQEMVLSEDRFYKRYNELNTKDDFDMLCFREAAVGTRLKRRYCIAVYVNREMQRFGEDYAEFAKANFNAGGGTTYNRTNDPPPLLGIYPRPPAPLIEARRKDFKQNMRDVVKRNPELVDMLRERDELGKRYEMTRRKVWGLKPLPDESQGASAEAIPP